jgi:hypothetical protein
VKKSEIFVNFVKKSDFIEKNVNFVILLKKNPAENACAFAQSGVYTHLLKKTRIYRYFCIFDDYFRPFTRVLNEIRVPTPGPGIFRERSVAYSRDQKLFSK